MSMLMRVKRFLNRFGYDIKTYRSFYDTVIIPLNIQTVIDIGANSGHFAKESRARFPKAHIYSFEPLHDCYTELQATMVDDEKFKSYNVALGEHKMTAEIQRSSFHPSSSLLPMAELHKKLYPKSTGMTPEQIQVERLDDILKNEVLAKNIFVKIDVQGFEDKVLKGGMSVMRQATIALIETSFVTLYENQPLFNDIHEIMRELGFVYYGDASRHYSSTSNKLIYEDSIFIKKESISI